MEKILFISTHYPSRLGGVRRLHYHLERFSRGFEVHFIRIKVDDEPDKAAISLPKGVVFREIKSGSVSPGLQPLLFPASAMRMMKIRSAQQQVQSYMDENKIDAVIVHAFDAVVALQGLRARVKVGEVLDSMQLYYDTKRESEASAYASFMSAFLSTAYPHVAKRLRSAYTLLVFVSEKDRECHGEGNGIALPDMRDPPLAQKNLGERADKVIVFGRWVHPPNRDGLAKIARGLGEIKGEVVIVGPGLAAGRKWPKNVTALGYVDDIDSLLSGSKLCLIPVWYGAGLQNKVFDALRCGCKVVSTPFTKGTFESNGFSSKSIVSAVDIVAAANKALASWSPSDAEGAYAAYSEFYVKMLAQEEDFARRVESLVADKK